MSVKRCNISKEFLEREYVENGKSLRDIASYFGCDKKTVSNRLREFGLPVSKNTYSSDDISREFLQREYVENGRSMRSIADEIGCEHNTISNKINKYGIEKRDDHYFVTKQISKEFLEREYLEKHRTMGEIAADLLCDRKSIAYHLNKFGIPIRTYDHSSNHVDVVESLLEWLDGTLLGDGHIGSESNMSAYYSLGQKHKEYVDFMSSVFEGFGITTCGIYSYSRELDSGKIGWIHRYITHSFIELLAQRKRWYPDGEKIIPKDVRLTPISLRAWLLEDGCFYTGGNNALGRITLSTNCFTWDDVAMLAERLNKLLDTKHIRVSTGYGSGFGCNKKYPLISFGHRDAIRKFFDYIAPLPSELHEKYGYKYLAV